MFFGLLVEQNFILKTSLGAAQLIKSQFYLPTIQLSTVMWNRVPTAFPKSNSSTFKVHFKAFSAPYSCDKCMDSIQIKSLLQHIKLNVFVPERVKIMLRDSVLQKWPDSGTICCVKRQKHVVSLWLCISLSEKALLKPWKHQIWSIFQHL